MIKRISASDIQNMESRYRANLFNCLSGFKSLNLIATQNLKGNLNLGLFSQVFHLGANPPLAGIIFRPAPPERHTLNNIRATQKGSFNLITEDFWQKAHQTSAKYPEEISEFDAVGLTPAISEISAIPYVKESPISVFFKPVREIDIVENGTTMLIVSIEEIYIGNDLIAEDGFLNLHLSKIITSTGLDGYFATELLGRLPYAKP